MRETLTVFAPFFALIGGAGAHAAGDGDDAGLVRADLDLHPAGGADLLELGEDLDGRARGAGVERDAVEAVLAAREDDRAARVGAAEAGRAGRGAAVGQQRAEQAADDVVGQHAAAAADDAAERLVDDAGDRVLDAADHAADGAGDAGDDAAGPREQAAERLSGLGDDAADVGQHAAEQRGLRRRRGDGGAGAERADREKRGDAARAKSGHMTPSAPARRCLNPCQTEDG